MIKDDKEIYYFASDFHLGLEKGNEALQRERIVVDWLNTLDRTNGALYLVGDLFDFWHEYKTVIPKGTTRFLGKLAELRDAGMPIEAFTGNHDMWMYGYFEEELGIPVHREPVRRTLQGKKLEIGHGDGLGPGDKTYKILKRIFDSPVAQFMFRWMHPDIGMRIARAWSRSSRNSHQESAEFHKEKEFLVQYCETVLESGKNTDYFVFGHRHLPLDLVLSNEKSRYVNLGDWIEHFTYATLENGEMKLRKWDRDR